MESGEIFENDNVRLEFRNDVVYGWYKAQSVDLEVAKDIVESRKKFTKNEPVRILVMQSGLKGIKKEARAYLSSDESIEGIIAAAILSNSAFQRHLANFFVAITVIRPKVPTKLFSDEKDALEWLQNFESNKLSA